jgi:protein-tyrosine phosphatase
VIDLHCHLLPGLDDGPADIQGSMAMANRAVAEEVVTIAATPHIREDHAVQIHELGERLQAMNAALQAAALPLEVVRGGELAITKVPELSDSELEAVCLGRGRYVLLESPYTATADLLENIVFELQSRGFRLLLAHPERSPCFLGHQPRLEALVERGVLCSVTAGSFAGRFGSTVQRFAIDLVRHGLVHNVASDAHDARRRPPGLMAGVRALGPESEELRSYADWLTVKVPSAVLAGADPPAGPPPPGHSSALKRAWVRIRR